MKTRWGEYWSARELAVLLERTRWQQFPAIITKAKIACETSGHAVSDHFQDVLLMIATGKGAHRRVEDTKLSRYACYLVVQNADPEKPVVALGQTYFAVQAREMELTQELITQMDEDQQRLFYREELARKNRRLAATATGAGVIKPRDFATFQDHGYRGLYNGETSRAIHERKVLEKREHILDWMGSEELAANIFKATQADAKIKREGIDTVDGANAAIYAAGRAVRRAIEELGQHSA